LDRDREAAARIGITGIPVFIVDDRGILEGAVPVELLREAAKTISSAFPIRSRFSIIRDHCSGG
jgi:predicted DsbA family dithiol-disulfide isomerase